ncbi:MAG: hypothetical protein MI748_00980 [Opitutales bacterium]|nr:hypothetical protein [Opitutales bacterium]
MKRNLIISIISTIALSLNLLAGSGSATAPWWLKIQDSHYTYIALTNISDADVYVYMTLKDKDGIIYNEASETGTNLSIEYNFIGDPLSNDGALLESGKMGLLRIKEVGPSKSGYCKIEWNSTGNNIRSLIGVVNQVVKDQNVERSSNYMLINNGLPF